MPRDINRIDPFLHELGLIWKTKCPDWRFGQLMFNAARVMKSHGEDIFYKEEDELLEYFREWFDTKEHNERAHKYTTNDTMITRETFDEIMKTKNYKEE